MADETQLLDAMFKEQFVAEWLRTGDPFKAGHAVFPGDPGRAMRASWEWVKDFEVLQYKAKLIEESGGSAGTPTREAFALELYRLANNSLDGEMKLKTLELFAKVQGWIAGGVTLNDNRSVSIVNKVMVIKDHGPNDAWERTLTVQQKRLQTG